MKMQTVSPNRGNYTGWVGAAAALLAVAICLPVSAEPPGGPGGRGGPGGPEGRGDRMQGPPHGGGGMGLGMLLRSEEVRTELGISEDQEEQLKAKGREMRETMREEFGEMKKGRRDRGGPKGEHGPKGERGPEADRGPRGERGPEADRGPKGERGPQGKRGPKGERGPKGDRGPQGGERGPKGPPPKGPDADARKKMQEKVEASLGEVLSTSQLERLKQIHVQQVVKIAGPLALVKGQLGEDLGITDQQREAMKEKGKEARKAMRDKLKEEMKAAKKEAQQSVMSVLTSEQQQSLAQMQGEPFDLELPNPRMANPRMDRRGGPEGREGFDGPRRRPGGEGREGKPRGSGKKKGGKRPGPGPGPDAPAED